MNTTDLSQSSMKPADCFEEAEVTPLLIEDERRLLLEGLCSIDELVDLIAAPSVLDLSTRDAEELAAWMESDSPQEVISLLLMGLGLGSLTISLDDVKRFIPPVSLPQSYLQSHARLRLPLVRLNPVAESIKDDRVWFRDVSAVFNSDFERVDIQARQFMMQASEEAFRILAPQDPVGLMGASLPMSLGALKYSAEDGKIAVFECWSDFEATFSKTITIDDKAEPLRAVLGDWRQELLAAFLFSALNQLSENGPLADEEVTIVFPEDRHLQQAVVRLLDSAGLGSKAASLEASEVSSFMLQLSTLERERLEEFLGNRFQTDTLEHQRYQALEALQQRFFGPSVSPSHNPGGVALSFPIPSGDTLLDSSPALRETFELAPSQPVRLAQVLGRKDQRFYEQELEARVCQVDAVLPKYFSLVSKGISAGASTEWWRLPAGGVDLVHLPLQNRHPSLRIPEYDQNGELKRIRFYGSKGSGLGVLEEEIKVHKQEQLEDVTLPFYRRVSPSLIRGDERSLINTHRYWGGMTLGFAESEFRATVELQRFAAEFCPEASHLLPLPVRCDRLLSVPTWDKSGKTAWVESHEFANSYFDEVGVAAGQFGVVLAEVPCDIRITTLLERVLYGPTRDRENVYLRAADIDSSLRFVYQLYGEDYISPDCPLESSIDARLGLASVMAYLRQVFELNRPAARRTFQKFVDESSALMFCLHDHGGYLGGGSLQLPGDTNVGAPFGGATTIRNMDPRGGFHDLDTSVYLPWSALSGASPSTRRVREFYCDKMQKFDLVYWAESVYWMKHLLFGTLDEDRSVPQDDLCLVSFSFEHDISHLDNQSVDTLCLKKIGEMVGHSVQSEEVRNSEEFLALTEGE